MFRRIIAAVAGGLAVISLAVSVKAADVYVSPGDWSGSRSTSLAGQLLATDKWTSAQGGVTIGWEISLSGDVYTYKYTFRRANGAALTGPGLSHFILSVSPDFGASDIWGTTGAVLEKGNPKVHVQNPGNPNLPGSFYGLKFEDPTGPIIFQTRRAPVWGDFYAKGGPNSSVWNAGFGQQPVANFNGWIARPDTVQRVSVEVDVIPEPAFFQMGAMVGFGALGLLRLRRKTGQ